MTATKWLEDQHREHLHRTTPWGYEREMFKAMTRLMDAVTTYYGMIND